MLFQSHKDFWYFMWMIFQYFITCKKTNLGHIIVLHWLEMYVYPCVHHYSWCSMPVPAGTFSHIKSYDVVTNPFIPLIHRGLACWPEILSIYCINAGWTAEEQKIQYVDYVFNWLLFLGWIWLGNGTYQLVLTGWHMVGNAWLRLWSWEWRQVVSHLTHWAISLTM